MVTTQMTKICWNTTTTHYKIKLNMQNFKNLILNRIHIDHVHLKFLSEYINIKYIN